jgi:hypothetical protein
MADGDLHSNGQAAFHVQFLTGDGNDPRAMRAWGWRQVHSRSRSLAHKAQADQIATLTRWSPGCARARAARRRKQTDRAIGALRAAGALGICHPRSAPYAPHVSQRAS